MDRETKAGGGRRASDRRPRAEAISALVIAMAVLSGVPAQAQGPIAGKPKEEAPAHYPEGPNREETFSPSAGARQAAGGTRSRRNSRAPVDARADRDDEARSFPQFESIPRRYGGKSLCQKVDESSHLGGRPAIRGIYSENAGEFDRLMI
jgi:hypothetical protein